MDYNILGAEKVAILLIGIGKEAAATIMRNMERDELAKVLFAMNNLRRVDQASVDQVFSELHDLLNQPGRIVGGHTQINQLIGRAFGAQAESISAKLGLDKPAGLPALTKISAESLGKYLSSEHPQTIAIVLAHLPAKKFAETLKQLPPACYAEVLGRIARLEAIDPDTLDQLNEVLEREASQSITRIDSLGGAKKVANLLNSLDQAQSEAMLKKISDENPELAEQVRQLMFTFEDLQKIGQRDLPHLMKEIARQDLLLAMKLASEGLLDHIYKSMSERAAKLLQEDLAALPKVKKSDVVTAQNLIASVARQLIEDGKMQIEDGEDFVA